MIKFLSLMNILAICLSGKETCNNHLLSILAEPGTGDVINTCN